MWPQTSQGMPAALECAPFVIPTEPNFPVFQLVELNHLTCSPRHSFVGAGVWAQGLMRARQTLHRWVAAPVSEALTILVLEN